MLGAEKMERNIRLVTDYPAVVTGSDVKRISRLHLIVAAIFHPASRATGHNQPDMLHLAQGRTGCSSNVFRPFPSRLIIGPANRHRSDPYGFEFSFFECAHFIRLPETLDQKVIVVR